MDGCEWMADEGVGGCEQGSVRALVTLVVQARPRALPVERLLEGREVDGAAGVVDLRANEAGASSARGCG